jgi:hypothetical protein
LIVTVKESSNSGEESDAEDLKVLHEGSGTATAHESLAPLQGGIVEAAMISSSCTHVGFWIFLLARGSSLCLLKVLVSGGMRAGWNDLVFLQQARPEKGQEARENSLAGEEKGRIPIY